MSKPLLLDLYCGAGGASLGYYRSGFEIVGVDNVFQRRYPFEFIEGDAIEFVTEHGDMFDAIHASPPCHYSSAATRGRDWQSMPNLVRPTRLQLDELGKPYVMENVAGAALIDPVWLCGTEFALACNDVDGTPLELRRHRGFETNWHLQDAGGCQHGKYADIVAGVYKGASRSKDLAKIRGGGYVPPKAIQAKLMGITWMSEKELHQAIPPAMTRFIGDQLMQVVAERATPDA